MILENLKWDGDGYTCRCPFPHQNEQNRLARDQAKVYDSGILHCFVCGSHNLAMGELVEALYDIGYSNKELAKYSKNLITEPLFHRGAGSTRPTLVERYVSYYLGKLWDGFELKDQFGNAVGKLLRISPRPDSGDNKAFVFGQRGFLYQGNTLTSTSERPLTVVEGVYDVLHDGYIATNGLPSEGALKRLVGHYYWLMPDGDVWQDPIKAKRMLKLIEWAEGQSTAAFLGVHFLKDGLDPKDVIDYNDYISLTVGSALDEFKTYLMEFTKGIQ